MNLNEEKIFFLKRKKKRIEKKSTWTTTDSKVGRWIVSDLFVCRTTGASAVLVKRRTAPLSSEPAVEGVAA